MVLVPQTMEGMRMNNFNKINGESVKKKIMLVLLLALFITQSLQAVPITSYEGTW